MAVRDDGAPALSRLKAAHNLNALRNIYLADALKRLLAALDNAGIAALSFKGPLLAKIAFGDLALRVFSDLDILVRERDVPRSADLLRNLGYAAETYDAEAFRSGFFDAVEGGFRNRQGPVLVDLHWRLSPGSYPFGPDGEEVWERSVREELDGVELRTLAHDDLLLYLCVHASRHGWASLKHVCDVAHLVRAGNLDWEAVIARAGRTRCLRMLRTGLLLASDLLGTPVPPDVIAAARSDRGAASLAASLGVGLLDSLNSDSEPARGEFRVSVGAIERAGDKVRYCAVRALRPTMLDWQFRPLPRRLYPLYYLVRPLRIAVERVRRLFRFFH